jgi:hypothetical protein
MEAACKPGGSYTTRLPTYTVYGHYMCHVAPELQISNNYILETEKEKA